MKLIHYVIVRRDLPLGVLAAMITHAAGESAVCVDDFEGATAVVLEAKNEEAIHKAADHLDKHGIGYAEIFEPDPPYNGQAMAIGVVPGKRDVLSPIMEPFQTLKVLDFPPTDDECYCTNCRNRRVDNDEA